MNKGIVIWESGAVMGQCGSLDIFERFASDAAENGATHIDISEIPKSTWQKEFMEPRDPHPEWDSWSVWSRPLVGVFKLFLPEKLKPWFPEDEIKRNLELLRSKCEILKKYNLKAALFGSEPMWLPEDVFQKHPTWRGAECQHPNISRLPYFSPCINNGEVLGMYRDSMKAIVTALPELDYYTMLTNDSASGLCWGHTYPGKNGPDACEHLPIVDQVVKFLDALQDGAKQAGKEGFIVNMFNCCFEVDGNVGYEKKLKENQSADGKNSKGEAIISQAMGNYSFHSRYYPVIGIPKAFTFLSELEVAHKKVSKGMKVCFGGGDFQKKLLIDIYREFDKSPSNGPSSRMNILFQVAKKKVGEDNAENLIEIWQNIEDAISVVAYCNQGVQLILCGPLMSRWITMPLVPDISKLSDDEKLYFQRGRIARDDLESINYRNMLGSEMSTDYELVGQVRLEHNVAISKLDHALKLADEILMKSNQENIKEEIDDLKLRLRAFKSIYKTTVNFIQYAYSLAVRGRHDEDLIFRDHYNLGLGINRGGYELRKIARSEMDNALELAKIIEEYDKPLIAMVENPEDEDGLSFGPDMVGHLRKKAGIMMKYWPDYNNIYSPIRRPRELKVPALGEEES